MDPTEAIESDLIGRARCRLRLGAALAMDPTEAKEFDLIGRARCRLRLGAVLAMDPAEATLPILADGGINFSDDERRMREGGRPPKPRMAGGAPDGPPPTSPFLENSWMLWPRAKRTDLVDPTLTERPLCRRLAGRITAPGWVAGISGTGALWSLVPSNATPAPPILPLPSSFVPRAPVVAVAAAAEDPSPRTHSWPAIVDRMIREDPPS